MPGIFWESCSAIANTYGDTIVLGVTERPTGSLCEGVQDAALLCRV